MADEWLAQNQPEVDYSGIPADRFWEQSAPVQPRQTYSFDEMMQPPREVDYTGMSPQVAQPTAETAVSTFGREALHAAGPLAAGAAAFPAGFAVGETVFPWGGGLVGGLVTGGLAAYGAARAAQAPSEYVLNKLGLGDDARQRAVSEEAHPWAAEAGRVLPQALMLAPSLEATLAQRGMGAIVGGVGEAVTQDQWDPAKIARAAASKRLDERT
jgi:hypothetical protein